MEIFFVKKIEIDPSTLSKSKKFLFVLNNITYTISLFILNKFIRAWQGLHLKKTTQDFFTKNSNFIFNQLTYKHYHTIFRRALLPYHDQPSIIYTNNILIVAQEIKEPTSGKAIKQAIDAIYETVKNLLSNNYYYSNNRGYIVKLPVKNRINVHRIIIQKSYKPSPLYSNLYFTKENRHIIHIITEKDYFFVINRLLTPTEFHHYLDFRAWLCEHKLNELYKITESDLLEQYLHNEKDKLSNRKLPIYEKNFDMRLDQWKAILNSLHRSTIDLSKTFEKQYHFILSHIAKLRLHEINLLRDRCVFHYENTKNKTLENKNEIDVSLPFGFVFIEHCQKSAEEVLKEFDIRLNSYRYQHQLRHCIVIIFIPNQTQNIEPRCNVTWYVHISEHLVDE